MNFQSFCNLKLPLIKNANNLKSSQKETSKLYFSFIYNFRFV